MITSDKIETGYITRETIEKIMVAQIARDWAELGKAHDDAIASMVIDDKAISAADLVEAQMRQIEVDGAIHKDNLIAVAKMHGCK